MAVELPAAQPDSTQLEVARDDAGLTIGEFWLRYIGLGGTATPAELAAALGGGRGLDRHQYNVAAVALNERFMDLDRDHPVPYAPVPKA
jgi:hypothetical protein